MAAVGVATSTEDTAESSRELAVRGHVSIGRRARLAFPVILATATPLPLC